MHSQVRFVDPQQQDLYRCLPIGRTIADMTRRIKEAGNEQKIAFAQIYLVDTLVLVLIVVALGLSLWHGAPPSKFSYGPPISALLDAKHG
jgi:hypothetical protein